MNLFEQSLGAESALQENGGIPENNGLVFADVQLPIVAEEYGVFLKWGGARFICAWE